MSANQHLGDRKRVPEVEFFASIFSVRATSCRPQRLRFLLVLRVPCDNMKAPVGQVWASISGSRVTTRTHRQVKFGFVGKHLCDRATAPTGRLEKHSNTKC